MSRIDKDGIAIGLLMLVDPGATHADVHIMGFQRLDDRLQPELHIGATDESIVMFPIAALLSCQGLD